jgi:hypothetical protein
MTVIKNSMIRIITPCNKQEEYKQNNAYKFKGIIIVDVSTIFIGFSTYLVLDFTLFYKVLTIKVIYLLHRHKTNSIC